MPHLDPQNKEYEPEVHKIIHFDDQKIYVMATGYICSYDLNVAEGQPQDTTMSKERLKRDRQVGSISYTKKKKKKLKRSNN